MKFWSIAGAVASVAVLSGCLGGEPLAPGEQSLNLGIPRSADCQLTGPDLRVELNENALGKGLSARGALDQSTLICTTESGQRVQTTGHRELFRRSQSASARLYSVRAGEVTMSGVQTIGTSQYEFWGDLIFTPVS